ncbi:S41 family peptidase [Emticicia sp. CRIBPO]|uniref:S41 family peptidase n=1 Tax=Emticicia sp. CRIBPO TaxID=2683258 RepID=UPI001E579117|nr:S41 family peptidase [Emticicia sp. CRIBPO]
MMIKQTLLLILCGLVIFRSSAQSSSEASFFLSYPCLSPDGSTVVFSYDGDLWITSVHALKPQKLTSMPGYETGARFSPDGRWIAFTGRRSGNADVFILSADSGEIKQLTFHSAADEVNSWSRDSDFIYFTSDRNGPLSGYKVSLKGETPVRVLGDYYFQNDHLLAEHPLTGDIFFNNTWESSYLVQRKGYKGPFNPDIQSYNPVTKQYRKYTDYIGKDYGATFDAQGNLFFLSDEGNGEANLYTIKNNKKTGLTRFGTSIRNAVVNAEGSRVVFEKDYQLFIYDVKAGISEKLSITLPRGAGLNAEKKFNIKGNITKFDVSPDGKKMAFTSRGELFVSNADGTSITRINKGKFERASEVRWLNDNHTLLFNQTAGGFLNWYTIGADGKSPLKSVTDDQRNNRSLSFNKSMTMGVYLSGRDEVRLMDLKTMQSKVLVKDEIWAIWADKTDPFFSPDDRYVCYTAHRNFEEDIFVCEISGGKTMNLTKTGVTETGPVWSPDGKYIYFTASRLNPAFPYGMQNPGIYRLPLQNFSRPFRSEKNIAKKDNPGIAVSIDTVNIMERVEQVGNLFSSKYLSNVFQKGDKTSLYFISDQDQGKWAVWRTTLRPFEEEKTEKVSGFKESRGVSLSMAGNDKGMFALVNGQIYRLNEDENKAELIELNFDFPGTLQDDFNQVFYNAWAKIDENFYDEQFNGVDWKKMRDKYASFLPFLNKRSDFRTLMHDMLGELNSSHQRFNSFGEEDFLPEAVRTMETGIVFHKEKPYVVSHVLKGSAADKTGVSVMEGDELVKVDSFRVEGNMSRDFYFTRTSLADETELTFRRNDNLFSVKIHPQNGISPSLYAQWIAGNQKRVTEKSKGKIAYVFMENVERAAFNQFIIEISRELEGKEGLILDLRYNDGGQMHDELLKFLSQKSYASWKYRGGKMTKQGNFTPSDKPIILLINEQTLSDGEMTATGFKGLKLGKVIGNESYHWEIYTRPFTLVDGSSVRVPSFGCYSLEGEDLDRHGVKPDIKVINTFVDNINGNDRQLDRALKELLK